MQTAPLYHPCELLYRIAAKNKIYGNVPGTCRITGKESTGIPYPTWVKDTFTDHAWLKPGNIVSNEALFSFEERSVEIQKMLNKEAGQKFRNYSHIIAGNIWYPLTKANKREMYQLITSGTCQVVCLSDSGQKHLYFKHRTGFWQLEDQFIVPDIDTLKFLHQRFSELLELGFSQTEIITGNYIGYRVMKAGLQAWKTIEDQIKPHRGTLIFNFTAWIMYNNNQNLSSI
jgi:hypothetical protein